MMEHSQGGTWRPNKVKSSLLSVRGHRSMLLFPVKQDSCVFIPWSFEGRSSPQMLQMFPSYRHPINRKRSLLPKFATLKHCNSWQMSPCTLKTEAMLHSSLFLQALLVLGHCHTCIKFYISLATSHFFHVLLKGFSLCNLIK